MPVLPPTETDYLTEKGLKFEECSDGASIGLVLKDYPLPAGKYDHSVADILILLPAGFPDAPPDMFYVFPWVRLAGVNAFPTRANVAHQFAGKSWQRWSRHSSDWRAGRDGIASFIKRVQHALETARA